MKDNIQKLVDAGVDGAVMFCALACGKYIHVYHLPIILISLIF